MVGSIPSHSGARQDLSRESSGKMRDRAEPFQPQTRVRLSIHAENRRILMNVAGFITSGAVVAVNSDATFGLASG
jgi:hypothetical protein